MLANGYDQEQQDRLFQLSLGMLCIAGFDGYLKSVNPAWEKTLGHSPTELMARPYIEFVHPDDLDSTLAEAQKLKGGTLTINFENRWRTRSGDYRWLSWDAIPDVDLQQIYAVARDISETKEIADKLRESEARQRGIVEAAPDGIITIDERGTIGSFNSAAEQIFGYSAAEILGQNVNLLMPSPYREQHDTYIERYLRTGEKKVIGIGREVSGLRKNGTVFPMELALSDVRLGNRHLFTAFIRDISARKLSEEQLRKLSLAVEQSPATVIITDTQGIIEYVNPRFTKTSGYTAAEAIGQNPRILKSGDMPPEAYQQMWDTITAGDTWRGEFHNQTKNGQLYWEAASISPVRNPEGDITHFLAVKEDITERKEAEADLKRLLAQLENSRDDMLSILDQLRLGVIMTDDQGRAIFVNQSCQRVLQLDRREVLGKPWQQACSFSKDVQARLTDMSERPSGTRDKVSVHFKTPQGQQYWMDVEIQDDPREPRRKIFYLYDMTAIHDLRRLLTDKGCFEGMVGKSEPMHVVFEQIRQLAKMDTTVLIEGETGTGKELVARAIHGIGHRKNKPFVALNCAGLADSLLSSQLFGHKRGAYTGAVENHQGVFETANRGTLFLDEIGDVSQIVQTSLLRVLQEKEIIRLGESKPRRIDVRIIAATHRDLNEQVKKGRFRPDLLYRIRVARVSLPPLRERRGDIPLLVESSIREFQAVNDTAVREVSNDAMRSLLDYQWPGNVRELQSAIEFAAIRCQGAAIQIEDLPPEMLALNQGHHSRRRGGDSERERFLAALEVANGNRTLTARHLGISRATLYRRMAELHIKS